MKVDTLYNDHLEGLIDDPFWRRQHTRLMNERIRFLSAMERLMESNADFYETGHQVIELARNAERLFLMSDPEERHRLLDTLLLNCNLTSGIPHYTYKKPFDILAKGSDSAIWQAVVDEYETMITPLLMAEIECFLNQANLHRVLRVTHCIWINFKKQI